MRSLEKLAVEKGLVKPETLKKTAETKVSELKPTENFEENVFKLCAALRSSGYVKYAEEVEDKFITFKKANDLYNVFKQTGADVINEAHPEGSPHLSMEGDAIVETILDKRKAIEKVVNKQPTGKLANIINLAKLIKQADESSDVVKKKYNEGIEGLLAAFNAVKGREILLGTIYLNVENVSSKWGFASVETHLNAMIENLKKWESKEPTVNNITQIGFFENAFELLLDKADDIADKDKYKGMARKAWGHLSEASELIKGNKPASTNEVSSENNVKTDQINAEIIFDTVKHYKNKLLSYKAAVSVSRSLKDEEKQAADKWISDEIKEFEKIESAFKSVPDSEKGTDFRNFQKLLEPLITEVKQFYTDWLE